MRIGLGIGIPMQSRVGAAAPADVTPPTLSAAAANAPGTTITLTYNEDLDTGSTPAAGAFSLGGTASTVASVSVTGSTVDLTLNTAAFRHETILVSYTPGASPIQDLAGNDAAALVNQAVTNNIAARAADPLAIVTSKTNVFFLSGDLGVTTLGAAVSAWANQGGTGVTGDATQGTGTAQPAHNATGLNGHGTVLFDGGTDVLSFASLDLPAPGTTPTFFWAVFRQKTWTSTDSVYGGGSTTTMRCRQGGAGTPALGCSNGTTGPDNTGAVLDTWTRLENLFNNGTSDYIKLAATSVTGTNTGNTNAASGAFVLGAHTGASGFSNIEVAAFGAWNGDLLAGEKTSLDSWVAAFFGAGVGI